MKKLGDAILLLIGYLIVVKLPLLFTFAGASEQTVSVAFIVVRSLLIGWSIFLVRKNAVSDAGFSFRNSRYPILILILVAWSALLLYQVYGNIPGNILWSGITLFVLLDALTVGFAEELFMRSFLQNYLMQQNPGSSPVLVIFVTALLFGLAHYSNLHETAFLKTTMQVVVAVSLGFLFGCLLYKTRFIYPLAVLHAIIDFSSFMDRLAEKETKAVQAFTMQNVWVHLVLALIVFGSGFLVLRWPFFKKKVGNYISV